MALTPEQIAEMDAALGGQSGGLNADTMAAMDAVLMDPSASPKKNFAQRVGEDANKRLQMAQDIQNANHNPVEEGFQMAGKVGAGLINDIAGEAFVSTGRGLSAITPNFIENPIKQAGKNVLDTMANSPVGDLARSAVQTYGNFAENHPRAARNIESAINIGGVAGAFTPAKSAAVAGSDLAGQGAKAVASGTGKVARGAANLAETAAVKALPQIDDGLKDVGKLALKHDVPVSFDQLTSSRAIKTAQKVSQDIPFSGQAGFRDKQVQALQKSLFKTVGIDADRFTPINMDKAFLEVGREFDDLGKGKVFGVNPLTKSITEIAEDARITSTEDALKNFRNAVEKVYKNVDADGNITGEKLNTLRSDINRLARKTSSADTKELLLDLENAIIENMTDGDLGLAEKFSKTKQKYKNLLVLEPLAAKAKGGNISPALLQNRVAKIYGRSFVRGQAGDIGELARIGSELLPELGGSDTLPKTLFAIGASTAGLANLPVTGAALGVNRVAQSGINRNQSVIRKALDKDLLKLPPAQARKILTKE